MIGAKAWGLADLQRIAGIKVLPAFVVTTNAFDTFLTACPDALSLISKLDGSTDSGEIKRSADAIQQIILTTAFPQALRASLVTAYQAFSTTLGEQDALVSVRSSATKED
jgi:phosphoenolpyruvate synthase/pyruvate phosphate dikinase